MQQGMDAVLEFWFAPDMEARWFSSTPEIDMEIADRFRNFMDGAIDGDFDDWSETAEGALALILLLDQFPRNLHRGTPRAFAGDERARQIARLAVERGFDRRRPLRERVFFYLPFGHSEDIADQDEGVRRAEGLGIAHYLARARMYRDIIARFGRFPHRNAVLGRQDTPAEQQFLRDSPV